MTPDRTAVLNLPLADLDFSVRASNCLEAARVMTVRELVRLTEDELLQLRSFGRTSLWGVRRALELRSLRTGMSERDVLRWERLGE